MSVIRLVLFAVLLILLVYVFAANAGQTVDLRFFDWEFLAVGLFWVVVISFAAGVIASLVAMGLRELRFRRELGRMRRQNTALQHELNELRSLPLQELADSANQGER